MPSKPELCVHCEHYVLIIHTKPNYLVLMQEDEFADFAIRGSGGIKQIKAYVSAWSCVSKRIVT